MVKDSEIQELSKKGYTCLKENRLPEALELFCKILETDADNNYALVGAGDASRRMGQLEEAEEYYGRCLDRHPTNSYALFGLADVYKAQDQYKKAVAVWERYLEQDKENITVLTRVGDAYRKLHDLYKSKRAYLKVLELEENNPYAVIGLGHLHYDFKEYRDALFYWEKMVDRPGKQVDKRVLTSIGNCYRKLKNFEEGVAYFEKALEMEPSNFYSLFGLADCYRGMNNPEKSLEYWNRILENDPQNKVILTRAGDAYCSVGDLKTATDYYRRALEIKYDLYAMLGLAIVARQYGKVDESIECLEKLIEQEPRNYRPYLELALCFVDKKDTPAAIGVLHRFTEFGIKNPRVSQLLETLQGEN